MSFESVVATPAYCSPTNEPQRSNYRSDPHPGPLYPKARSSVGRVFIPYALSVSKFIFATVSGGGDTNAGHLYDFGFYNTSGTQVFNIGAPSYTSSGLYIQSFAQGLLTINPGMYWLAWTCNTSSPDLAPAGYAVNGVEPFGIFNSLTGNPQWFHSSTSSSGGALPSSITAPSPVAATNIDISGSTYGPTDSKTSMLFALTSY
jgi:hypothetical protein